MVWPPLSSGVTTHLSISSQLAGFDLSEEELMESVLRMLTATHFLFHAMCNPRGQDAVCTRGHTFHYGPFLLGVHTYPFNTFFTEVCPEDFLLH